MDATKMALHGPIIAKIVTCALKDRQDKGQDTDTALDENEKPA